MLSKVLAGLVLVVAYPIVKAVSWWDERSLSDHEAFESEWRRD